VVRNRGWEGKMLGRSSQKQICFVDWSQFPKNAIATATRPSGLSGWERSSIGSRNIAEGLANKRSSRVAQTIARAKLAASDQPDSFCWRTPIATRTWKAWSGRTSGGGVSYTGRSRALGSSSEIDTYPAGIKAKIIEESSNRGLKQSSTVVAWVYTEVWRGEDQKRAFITWK
jgi:hypothetical protein